MWSFKQRKSWAVWISKRSVGRFSTDGNDGYGSNFYGFPSRLVPAEIVWFYAKKHDQLGGCFSPTHHKGSALMNFSFRSRAMVSGVIEFPMFFSEKNWRLAMRPSSMVFGGNPIWLWSASRSLASGIQRVAVRAARTMPKRKGGEFRQQRSWFPDSFGQFIQWSFLCMPSTGKKPKNSMDELMSTNTNWHFYHLPPAIHLPKFLVWLLLTRPWDFDSGSSRGSEVACGSQCQVWRYPPRWDGVIGVIVKWRYMKGWLRLLVSGAAFGLDLLRDTLDPLVIKRGNGESPHFMMGFPIKSSISRVFSSHLRWHRLARQESFILQDPDDEEVIEALAEEPFVDDYLDCPAETVSATRQSCFNGEC